MVSNLIGQRRSRWHVILFSAVTLVASTVLSVACWVGFAAPALAMSTPAAPVMASLFSFSGSRPTNLGLQDGRLAACPSTPNCVSSQVQDATHGIAPLPYTATPEATFSQLKAIVQALPRTRLIQSTEDYLYVEFTSDLMGFVDDVEFYLDRSAQKIQVRSASRLGESDLGVNRQRIEAIRTALQTTVTPRLPVDESVRSGF